MVENIQAYETAVLDRICAVCIDDDRLAGFIESKNRSGELHAHGRSNTSVGINFDTDTGAYQVNLTWSDLSDRPTTVGQY